MKLIYLSINRSTQYYQMNHAVIELIANQYEVGMFDMYEFLNRIYNKIIDNKINPKSYYHGLDQSIDIEHFDEVVEWITYAIERIFDSHARNSIRSYGLRTRLIVRCNRTISCAVFKILYGGVPTSIVKYLLNSHNWISIDQHVKAIGYADPDDFKSDDQMIAYMTRLIGQGMPHELYHLFSQNEVLECNLVNNKITTAILRGCVDAYILACRGNTSWDAKIAGWIYKVHSHLTTNYIPICLQFPPQLSEIVFNGISLNEMNYRNYGMCLNVWLIVMEYYITIPRGTKKINRYTRDYSVN